MDMHKKIEKLLKEFSEKLKSEFTGSDEEVVLKEAAFQVFDKVKEEEGFSPLMVTCYINAQGQYVCPKF